MVKIIQKAINDGNLFDKIAVVLFGATATPEQPLNDENIDPIPVISNPGGIIGVKRTFKACRNIQGTLTKKATYLNKNTNLNKTLNKSRTNADVQPLFKDTGIIDKPTDMGTLATTRQSNKQLSHLEDRRIKQRARLIKINK